MFGFRNHQEYARASEALEQAGYTEAGVQTALGVEDLLAVTAGDQPWALRRTCEPAPLNTLIRLFFLATPMPEALVRSALAPASLETWIAGKLLMPPGGDGRVAPLIQIWPFGNLRLAVDISRQRTTQPGPDFVVPPGPITRQLAHARVRRPCRAALDLGTGSGALALLMSPEAERVVATDKNSRAIEFARFNARFNRLENIETLLGDGLEPVGGRRFERILCNPPFVIGPTQRFMFRDSGLRGDVFCRQLLRTMVEHLEPGGYVQMTANLPHEAGCDWQASLHEWFDGIGGDALALVQRTDDVSEYAMTWVVSTESTDAAEASRRFDAWMDYFAQERIEAVSYLLLVVRRRKGASSWVQIDEPPCHILGPCGEEFVAFFEMRDALADNRGMERLLEQRLVMSPHAAIEQEHVMTPEGLQVRRTRLKKTGGLQYPLAIDQSVARLLAGCDGTRIFRCQLDAMAAELEVDRTKLLAAVAPPVRSLLERSVLLAADRSAR